MSTQKTADEKPKRGWWPFGGSSSSDEGAEAEPERGVSARKGRATPGRRATEPEESGNIVVRSVTGIREYIEGVQSEINKVAWPSREETRRLSLIVLVATLLSSLVLGLITLAYSELFRIGVNQPLIFLGFFVGVIVIGFVLYRRTSHSDRPSY
ncbi:MAG: preprotein translocase subunit SecE [Anaerolineaceae bacterium]|nr:preprotein translocase subunit SecE [Anaerolineaceae bacterium]